MNTIAMPWRSAPVYYYDSLPSTNTRLKEMALAGCQESTVLVAGRQSAGRGRLGRSFLSPEGGIYLSMLLKPDCPPEQTLSLTPCTAVAICRTIQQLYGFAPDIKWPNDLLLHDAKVCGILCESLFLEAQQYLILGMGLNANTPASAFPPDLQQTASSLLIQSGKRLPLSLLAETLVAQLDAMVLSWQNDFRSCLDEYRRLCISCRQPVQLIQNGICQNAYSMEIDEDYALVVRLENGQLSHIHCGEVSLRQVKG